MFLKDILEIEPTEAGQNAETHSDRGEAASERAYHDREVFKGGQPDDARTDGKSNRNLGLVEFFPALFAGNDDVGVDPKPVKDILARLDDQDVPGLDVYVTEALAIQVFAPTEC